MECCIILDKYSPTWTFPQFSWLPLFVNFKQNTYTLVRVVCCAREQGGELFAALSTLADKNQKRESRLMAGLFFARITMETLFCSLSQGRLQHSGQYIYM